MSKRARCDVMAVLMGELERGPSTVTAERLACGAMDALRVPITVPSGTWCRLGVHELLEMPLAPLMWRPRRN